MISPEPGHVREVCRLGQGADCCRYLVGRSGGLHCAKFVQAVAAHLDRRVREGTITARGDNCPGADPDVALPD